MKRSILFAVKIAFVSAMLLPTGQAAHPSAFSPAVIQQIRLDAEKEARTQAQKKIPQILLTHFRRFPKTTAIVSWGVSTYLRSGRRLLWVGVRWDTAQPDFHPSSPAIFALLNCLSKV